MTADCDVIKGHGGKKTAGDESRYVGKHPGKANKKNRGGERVLSQGEIARKKTKKAEGPWRSRKAEKAVWLPAPRGKSLEDLGCRTQEA